MHKLILIYRRKLNSFSFLILFFYKYLFSIYWEVYSNKTIGSNYIFSKSRCSLLVLLPACVFHHPLFGFWVEHHLLNVSQFALNVKFHPPSPFFFIVISTLNKALSFKKIVCGNILSECTVIKYFLVEWDCSSMTIRYSA